MREPIIGGNFSHAYHDRQKYGIPIEGGLLVIDEDTTFVGSNFIQAEPHTPVFSVRNGARLVLQDVNAVNVTLPDEMAPDDFTGNNAQVVTTATGNPERPTVNLLHECTTCACFVKVLRANLRGFVDARGRILLARHKQAARARRLNPSLAASDLAELQAENAAALARWKK